MQLDNQTKFQFDAQLKINDLINVAAREYDYDNVYELAYDLGSALASSMFNLLETVFDDQKDLANKAFDQMVENTNKGIQRKKELLNDPNDNLIRVYETNTTVQ